MPEFDRNESRSGAGGSPEVELVEVCDENDPDAEAALRLIAENFDARERQPLAELRSEIAEKRLQLLEPFDFHLVVAREGGRVVGAVAGAYLAGVNAGFITYLAVDPAARGAGLGGALRARLTAAFIDDARRAEHDDPNWVLGEVRLRSKWLRRLVEKRGAIVFDFDYYHPGMRIDGTEPYALYREPIGDHRRVLPVGEVRRVLYSIWRRGYRVRYPLERETFQAMLAELEGMREVGPREPPG